MEAALFGAEPAQTREPERAVPDFAAIHQQRQTKRFVTLQLLWQEYREANPDGYGYSRFCELYQRWRGKQDVVLRQEYKAGEKLFVDWAGPTIPIYSRTGGPTEEAHLFVAVLGASSYTYAEATRDEQMINWLTAHMRAFEFFGGLPNRRRYAVTRGCSVSIFIGILRVVYDDDFCRAFCRFQLQPKFFLYCGKDRRAIR